MTFTESDWYTQQEVTVGAAHDPDAQDDQATITHSTASTDANYDAVTVNDVPVTVTDDESRVSFEMAAHSVLEANTISVKVQLSRPRTEQTVVPITTTPQDGATAADYSGVPGTVTFQTGDTEEEFTFAATHDTLDDDDESVILSFGTLPDHIIGGDHTQAVVSITDDDDPEVSITFEQSSYTVSESDDAATTDVEENKTTIKVQLNADPERTVTIPIARIHQDGSDTDTASAADYSGVPASLTLHSGDTEEEFTLTAVNDSVDDDGESVTFSFGTFPARVSAGATNEAVVNITDDDKPTAITVNFGAAGYTAAEGSTVDVKLTLSDNPETDLTILIDVTHHGGASNADYSGVPTAVTFHANDTEQEFTFSALDDSADDDGESVKLTFGTLPDVALTGSTNQAVISITDNDDPEVTVSFGTANYQVDEGSGVSVQITLSADPERTVTIPLTKANQDGASSADYSGVPANVVFNAGDTEKSITFTATADDANDDGESVKLGFDTLPTGVSTGSTNETIVSITDDDVPSVEVSFEQGSYTVAEGDSVTIKVKLNADPERTVTIPLTKADHGGATSADYSGVPANVVFNASDTEKSITFSATADDANDDGESVKLGFDTLPAGVSAGSTNEAIVSITDDDVPSVEVSYGQGSYTVAEGDNVTIKVKLDADPERTVTIPLTKANQDGASSADYSGVPANVVFNASDTEKSITFTATADDANDDGESVKLGFDTLPTGVSTGSTNETIVSITDDDVPSVEVSFEQGSYTVAEGDSVTIKVKLDADPERTVTIPLTKAEQDGASNSDYSGVPANVVFNASDTEKSFTFTATADDDNDDGESVKLGFDNSLPAGVSAGTTNEAIVSITDDDAPTVEVTFDQESYTVAEGSSVTIKVQLDANPERTVTIPLIKANQDGASDEDHSGVPADISFNPGETSKTFTFTANDDTLDDDDESVKLTFGTLPTNVSAGTQSQAVVSITDDDVPAVNVEFGSVSYSVDEDDDVTVTLTLSADPERTLTIPITKTNHGGATDADYSGVPTTVAFNPGDTSKTFVFTATGDEDDDDGESVRLRLEALPDGVTAGTRGETTVAINDDDAPAQELVSVLVSFEGAALATTEGSTVEVIVTLSADPERSMSIPLTAAAGTGLTTDDYSGVPSALDFVSGDTQKFFSLTAVQDDIDESDETLTLGFNTLPDAVTLGGTTQTIITIVDSIRVAFHASSYQAHEGGAGANVIVELDRAPAMETVIPLTAIGVAGATNDDWTGVPATLTFAPGDTQKFFTLMAYDDQEEDSGESVELGFGPLPAGIAAGNPSQTTVELMNTEVPTPQPVNECPVDTGERIVMVANGDITPDSGTGVWRVGLDPMRVYVVEVIGKDTGPDVTGAENPGNLTLADPHINAHWNDDRTELHKSGDSRTRTRLNIVRASGPSGIHHIEVRSFDDNTGTYQIRVRVNNLCVMSDGNPVYPYYGGPDGYIFDVESEPNTRGFLRPRPHETVHLAQWGFLGDNWDWYWDEVPDEDWYRIEGADPDYEYTVNVWTDQASPEKHQATQLKILGIKDSDKNVVAGPSEVGKAVSLTFIPVDNGIHYVSVGSGSSDRTGLYRIEITDRKIR